MLKIIILLLFVLCLVPVFLLRKKIGYYFCPDEVLSEKFKHRTFVISSFILSICLAVYVVIWLREFFKTNEGFEEYEKYVLLYGLACLPIFIVITGIITDKVLSKLHPKYREWKELET